MANRALKSGLAKEAHQKVLAKYNAQQATEALEWMSSVLGEEFSTDGSMENVREQLKDGTRLCK